MTDDEIRQAIEPYIEKLHALTSPSEVRDFLVAEEVQGVPFKGSSCPIATYLQRNSGLEVVVSRTATHYSGMHTLNTKAMTRFTMGFDGGLYPELELP